MFDLVLKDFFALPPAAGKLGGASSNPDVRNSALNSRGLMATIEASHAGRLTSNNALYPPRFMEISAPTFTIPYPKPIQIHHDNHSDPIGRIYSARFISYSDTYRSQYKDSVIRDGFSKLYDSTSIDDIFDGLDVLENSGILYDESWKGLGELELRGLITDQAAIEKILDNRYLNVSIQFSPRTVYCRKCKQDWRKVGPCGHAPGEVIDGKKNYLVAGPGTYGEVSYINHPADPFAGTKNVQLISMGDNPSLSHENSNGSLDKKDERHVTYEIVDSMIEGTENNVDIQEDNSQEVVAEDVVETVVVSDSTVVDEVVLETVQSAQETSDQEPVLEIESAIDEAVRILIEDESSFTDKHAELINKEIEDAVLSAKQRENLPSSNFCGPNKSFPIPSCDHVKSARSLIGRYKGPGSKEKILACVDTKAKTLGCDKSEEDSTSTDCGCLVRGMTNDEILSLRTGIEEEVVKRNLSLPAAEIEPARTCSDCVDRDSKIKLQEDTISHLREECKIISSDCVSSDKALIEKTSKLQDSYRSTLVLFKQLLEKTTPVNEIKDSVDAMSFEELELSLKQTDLTQIVDFVRSGLTRIPQVEIPVEEQPSTRIDIRDSVQVQTEPGTQIINMDEVNYAKSIVSLRASKGTQYAVRYLDALKSAKKINSDWTLEKASDLAAKS